MNEQATLKSTFAVPKMDCPSEEAMIRMALREVDGVKSLAFDLGSRRLTAVHSAPASKLLEKLEPLGLGAQLEASAPAGGAPTRSRFSIPKMDCASEESMARMALGEVAGIRSLTFNLPARELVAVHEGPAEGLLAKLAPLGLRASLVESGAAASRETTFAIPRMDCPSEENMIRMALRDSPGVQSLAFDLQARELTAVHHGSAEALLEKLEPLGLGAKIAREAERSADLDEIAPPDTAAEASLLRRMLAINASMFVIGLVVGVIAQSTGLIADSLDMFADAAVLGLSLFAVGRPVAHQKRAARAAGWLQMILALGAFAEVVRRFLFGSEPASELMIIMGACALVANAYCLWAMAKRRNDGAHMRASYIFLANDVIANGGVILAGALVAWTGSRYPDLVIGAIVASVVLLGARRILALK